MSQNYLATARAFVRTEYDQTAKVTASGQALLLDRSVSAMYDQTTKGIEAPMVEVWEAGEAAIGKLYQWFGERHQELGEPLFVIDEEWNRLEAVVEDAYLTRDLDQLQAALKAMGQHMLGQCRRSRA